jgi:site-specific recombinase XerD
VAGKRDRSLKWAGGYISVKKVAGKKRLVYFVYKKIRGRLYEVSTHCDNEVSGRKQWERFQEQPEAYEPTPKPDLMPEGPAPLLLDATLSRSYLEGCKRGRPDRDGNSEEYLRNKKRYIAWWAERLFGQDLRKLDTRTILRSLRVNQDPLGDYVTCYAHRIATIKHLYSWLTDIQHGAGVLEPAENPTVAIKVPQSRRAQATKLKVFSAEDFKRVFEILGQDRGGRRIGYAEGHSWRQDVLLVLVDTGWHFSEVRRFAQAGEFEPLPEGRARDGWVGLVVKHKNGGRHATEVGPLVAEAAGRLRARGHVPKWTLWASMRRISNRLGLKVAVTPGRFRHFVATYAKNKGAHQNAITTFEGHKSENTTLTYNLRAVPARVPTLLDTWTPMLTGS